MSETLFPQHPAQEALRYYQSYRQSHPLPTGWTEKHIHSPEDVDGSEDHTILLESERHLVHLVISETDPWSGSDGRLTYMDVLRKDEQLPTAQESIGVAKLLLGQELVLTPRTYCILEGYEPDGRPKLLGGPDPAHEPERHYALELRCNYPPYATKSISLTKHLAVFRDLANPTDIVDSETRATLAVYAGLLLEADEQSALTTLIRHYPTYCAFYTAVGETACECEALIRHLTDDSIHLDEVGHIINGQYAHEYASLHFTQANSPADDPTRTLKTMEEIFAPLLAKVSSFLGYSRFTLNLDNNRACLHAPLVYLPMLVAYLQLRLQQKRALEQALGVPTDVHVQADNYRQPVNA